MPEMKIEHVETHRDERWAYGKRYVNDEYVSDWMKFIGEEKKIRAPEYVREGYAERAFKYLMNEVEPRCKKLGIELSEFPLGSEFHSIFLHLEMDGKITRKKTREYLDTAVRMYQEGSR